MSRVKFAARASAPEFAGARSENSEGVQPTAAVKRAAARPAAARAATAAPSATRRASLPFYRREPWLAALLLSFITALGAVLTGPPVQMPLFYVTIVLVVAGVLLLIFQKPDPEADRLMREREGMY